MTVQIESLMLPPESSGIRTPGDGRSSRVHWFTRGQNWELSYSPMLGLIEIARGEHRRLVTMTGIEITPMAGEPTLADMENAVEQARTRQKGGGKAA